MRFPKCVFLSILSSVLFSPILFTPQTLYSSETFPEQSNHLFVAQAQQVIPLTATLSKGIEEYKNENFEEALEILTRARKEDPGSSVAAFYLGLTHKQLMNYREAAENFRDAVQLKPPVKDAVVELIEVLYALSELIEANKWLALAEKEDIKPAQTAFLKGLLLLKENKNLEAIKAFEKAKELDKGYTQAADFQIGNAYLKERRLSEARERFRAIVVVDPLTDLAAFAREYEEAITERLYLEREWRFSLGLAYQYDDNVVLKPGLEILGVAITEDEDSAVVSTFSAAYVPRLTGPWTLNAQYSLYSNIHRKIESHDIMSHTFSIVPGYNFKKASLNLFLSYNHTWLNNKRYLSSISSTPTLNIALNSNQIGQLSLGYSKKEFLWTQTPQGTPIDADEDRDANAFSASAGWIYLFSEGEGFLNLRYEISREDTDGKNWEYVGNRVNANVLIPLKKRLKLNLLGEIFWQDFENVHTIFGVERKDEIYTASAVLSYELFRGATAYIQYTFLRDDSNIAVYDYKRNIYSAGIEYRF